VEGRVGTFVLRFEAIGTQWEIETSEPLGRPLRRRILERIRQFDTTYSRFRPDSLVARVAAATDGGRFDFPEDSVALFDLYDRLHAATGGAVDPLVGRDLELLGYDRTYSLIPASDFLRAEVHAWGRATWSTDVVRDGTSLVTRRPLVIDVGAAGKGYLVDIVSEMLREAGLTQFVVDGSGDLRHSGGSGIRVGLEHPFDPGQAIGVINLQGRALCASAVTRRAWGDGLHHVLDARTGVPVRDVVATWVVADEAATADGLATALFFTTPERLAEGFRFSYVRMFANGRAEISHDCDGELYSSGRNRSSRRPRGHHGAARASRPPRRDTRGMATLSKRLRITTMAAISASLVMAPCWPTGTAGVRAAIVSDGSAIRSGSATGNDSAYVDGVYTATGQYGGFPSSITVTVTLVDDVITAVTVTPHATNPTSLEFQRRFAAAIPAVVVGKRIDEVRVSRLAGSSGTPEGFNAAIQRIKEQARTGRTSSK
jgi:FAD:protein FMN transferase